MKKLLLLITIALLTSLSADAQSRKLVVGDKAPELSPKQWLISEPRMEGKHTMVEFFHSLNRNASQRLEALDEIARKGSGKLTVILVIREVNPKVNLLVTSGNPSYYPMLDDGIKTFTSYKVQHVPYSVLYDKKGRILWLGNPSSLSAEELLDMIK